jgi:hypothetical protein
MFDDDKTTQGGSNTTPPSNPIKNTGNESRITPPPIPGDTPQAESSSPSPSPQPTPRKDLDDIFSDTTDTSPPPVPEKPAAFRPMEKEPGIAPAPITNEAPTPSRISGKRLPIVIIIGFFVFTIGGYAAYKVFIGGITESIEPTAEPAVITPEVPTNPAVPAQPQPTQPSANELKDSDNDGLTDQEERDIGSDVNNQDTDSDGLYDREEVRVYKTNPLIADTDGDGYLDGVEVEGNYNPKGSGRLYEIN